MLVEGPFAPFQAKLNAILASSSPSVIEEVSEQVFEDLLDEVTLGIGFEIHRFVSFS